jgi:hypothetical protein
VIFACGATVSPQRKPAQIGASDAEKNNASSPDSLLQFFPS